MGYLTDRVEELGDEYDDIAVGDELDTTNQLLALIARELTGEDTGYFEDGFEATRPGETDDGRQTATYSSVEDLPATTDVQTVTWGFGADTVAIRNLPDDLDIAFKDPDSSNDAWIPVDSADAPFVLSGVYGISASQMWFRQADSASGPHNFDVLAVQREGGGR